jgi:regulator of sigma E protease
MELLQTIIVALVTLGLLVTIHEFGHYWVARRCGVKVLRFSIGFGTPLWRRQNREGTEFTLAAIPLGGYVKMLDEREGDVDIADAPYAFNRQSVWARIAVVAAGPLANFLLAIVVFWALFLQGERGLVPVVGEVLPETPADLAGLEVGQEIVSIDGRETPTVSALNLRLLSRLGESGAITVGVRYPNSDVVYESEAPIERWLAGDEQPDLMAGLGIALDRIPVPPVLEAVVPEAPADRAGFLAGDRVVSADGQPMSEWVDWVDYVRARPGELIDVVVARDGLELTLPLTPERVGQGDDAYGSVGMQVVVPEIPESRLRAFNRGPIESLLAAADRTGDLIVFTFESMWKMLQGLISPKNLSGPITIAQVAASSAESGLSSWLGFLALLSVSLGALNLLPIPVLDGGHLLFYGVEALTGRPVPEKIQVVGYQVGLALVLSIMGFALYNDLLRQ